MMLVNGRGEKNRPSRSCGFAMMVSLAAAATAHSAVGNEYDGSGGWAVAGEVVYAALPLAEGIEAVRVFDDAAAFREWSLAETGFDPLLDRDGELVGFFPPMSTGDEDAEEMLGRLQELFMSLGGRHGFFEIDGQRVYLDPYIEAAGAARAGGVQPFYVADVTAEEAQRVEDNAESLFDQRESTDAQTERESTARSSSSLPEDDEQCGGHPNGRTLCIRGDIDTRGWRKFTRIWTVETEIERGGSGKYDSWVGVYAVVSAENMDTVTRGPRFEFGRRADKRIRAFVQTKPDDRKVGVCGYHTGGYGRSGFPVVQFQTQKVDKHMKQPCPPF
ncbi:MAG: hypothetical protein AAFR76_10265, partial [Planctomycetota bacterium]